MSDSDSRDLRAQQALWSGLRRFTDHHEQGLTPDRSG